MLKCILQLLYKKKENKFISFVYFILLVLKAQSHDRSDLPPVKVHIVTIYP